MLAVGALVAGAGVADAQTKDQLKCQAGTSKAGQKFIGKKTKCILKCEANARKGKNAFADCDPPYAGSTLFCIADVAKGAQTKLAASLLKACTKKPGQCPSCYSGGDCSVTGNTAAVVANLEAQLDAFAPAVACEETTDKAIAKCIDGNAKALVKFSGAKTKCFDKCYASEAKGKTDGACTPGAVTDTKTAACIQKAEGKAIASIDKVCFTPGKTTPPACYNDGVTPPAVLPSPSTAAGWVSLVELAVDSVVPTTYCGSPSGAFLD